MYVDTDIASVLMCCSVLVVLVVFKAFVAPSVVFVCKAFASFAMFVTIGGDASDAVIGGFVSGANADGTYTGGGAGG